MITHNWIIENSKQAKPVDQKHQTTRNSNPILQRSHSQPHNTLTTPNIIINIDSININKSITNYSLTKKKDKHRTSIAIDGSFINVYGEANKLSNPKKFSWSEDFFDRYWKTQEPKYHICIMTTSESNLNETFQVYDILVNRLAIK